MPETNESSSIELSQSGLIETSNSAADVSMAFLTEFLDHAKRSVTDQGRQSETSADTLFSILQNHSDALNFSMPAAFESGTGGVLAANSNRAIQRPQFEFTPALKEFPDLTIFWDEPAFQEQALGGQDLHLRSDGGLSPSSIWEHLWRSYRENPTCLSLLLGLSNPSDQAGGDSANSLRALGIRLLQDDSMARQLLIDVATSGSAEDRRLAINTLVNASLCGEPGSGSARQALIDLSRNPALADIVITALTTEGNGGAQLLQEIRQPWINHYNSLSHRAASGGMTSLDILFVDAAPDCPRATMALRAIIEASRSNGQASHWASNRLPNFINATMQGPDSVNATARLWASLQQLAGDGIDVSQYISQIARSEINPFNVLAHRVARGQTNADGMEALGQLNNLLQADGPASDLALRAYIRMGVPQANGDNIATRAARNNLPYWMPSNQAMGRLFEQAAQGNRDAQETVHSLSTISTACRNAAVQRLMRSYTAESHALMPLLTAIVIDAELPPSATNDQQLQRQCEQAINRLNQELRTRLANDFPQERNEWQQSSGQSSGLIVQLLARASASSDAIGQRAAFTLATYAVSNREFYSHGPAESPVLTPVYQHPGCDLEQASMFIVENCARVYTQGNLSDNGSHLLHRTVYLANRGFPDQFGTNASRYVNYNHRPARLNQIIQTINGSSSYPEATQILRPLVLGESMAAFHGPLAERTAWNQVAQDPEILRSHPSYREFLNQHCQTILETLNSDSQDRINLLTANGAGIAPLINFIQEYPQRTNDVLSALLNAHEHRSSSVGNTFLEMIDRIGRLTPHGTANFLAERAAEDSDALSSLIRIATTNNTETRESASQAQESLVRLALNSPQLRDPILQGLLSSFRPTPRMLQIVEALNAGREQVNGSLTSNQILESLAQQSSNGNQLATEILLLTAASPDGNNGASNQAYSILARGSIVEDSGTFEQLLEAVALRAQRAGDRQNIDVLVIGASSTGLSTVLRQRALQCLVATTLSTTGSVADQETRIDDIVNTVLERWSDQETAQMFELMTELSEILPWRSDLTDALLSGYEDFMSGNPSHSLADNSVDRLGASLTILSNAELLTQEMVERMVSNATPELAQALDSVELPEQAIETFLITLRSSAENANIDFLAIAQSIGALARYADSEDAEALCHLRERSTSDTERTAIDTAIFLLATTANNRSTRQAAVQALTGRLLWSRLSADERTAVTSFAMQGHCNLHYLQSACNRIEGSNAHYPLAVTLHAFGIAGSGEELCQLSDRMASNVTSSGIHSFNNWVLPLLTSASIASQDPSESVRQQIGNVSAPHFMRQVVDDLASGRLDTSRQFLVSYVGGLQQRFEVLGNRQTEILNEIARIALLLGNGPQQLLNAQQDVDSTTQTLRNAEHGPAPLTDSTPIGLGHARQQFVQASDNLELVQALTVGNFTNLQNRLDELRQQLQSLNVELERTQTALNIGSYQALAGTGQTSQAMLVMNQIMARGSGVPQHLIPEVERLWAQLRDRGLAPCQNPPLGFSGPNPSQAAFDALVNLTERQNTEQLSPESLILHVGAVNAAADAYMYQLISDPAIQQLGSLTEDIALRIPILMQYFQTGASSPNRSDRQQIANMLRPHVEQLRDMLSRPETQTQITNLIELSGDLQFRANQLPSGSEARQRLDRLIATLNAYKEILRPGSEFRQLLDNIHNGLQNNALNESWWAEAASTVAHVATTAAAFAAASAITAATGGAGGPVAFALIAASLTMAARQGTQEALHQFHLTDSGSSVMDFMNGRVIYDPGTGQFRQRTRQEVLNGLGNEFAQDVAMNLAFWGVDRAFSLAGRYVGSTLPGMARVYGRPDTVWQTFRRSLFEGFGYGLATAAPDLAGIEGLGTQIGFAIAAFQGFRNGMRAGAALRNFELRQRELTQQQRSNLLQHLSTTQGLTNTNRDILVEISSFLPENMRNHALDVVRSANTAGRNTLVERLSSLSRQDGAGLLANLHGMTNSERANVINQLSGPNGQQLSQVLARTARPDIFLNLLEVINCLPVEHRAQAIEALRTSPNSITTAIGQISNSAERLRALETIGRLAGREGFSQNSQALMNRIPGQQLATFLDTLAQLPNNEAARIGSSLLEHPQAQRLIEALSIIPENGRRTASLQSLSVLDPATAGRILDAIGEFGDSHLRASFMRELGGFSQTQRNAILQVVSSVESASARVELLDTLTASPQRLANALRSLSLLEGHPLRQAILDGLIHQDQRDSHLDLISSDGATDYLACMRDSGLTIEQALRMRALAQPQRSLMESMLRAQARPNSREAWQTEITRVAEGIPPQSERPAPVSLENHQSPGNNIGSRPQIDLRVGRATSEIIVDLARVAGLRPEHLAMLGNNRRSIEIFAEALNRGILTPENLRLYLSSRNTSELACEVMALQIQEPVLSEDGAATQHTMAPVQPLASIDMPAPGQDLIIGRNATLANSLLNFTRVSRQHFRLSNLNGELVVTDLSTHGTFIRQADGTVIRINGGHTIQHGEQVLLAPNGPSINLSSGRVELLPPGAQRAPVVPQITPPGPSIVPQPAVGQEVIIGRQNCFARQLSLFHHISRSHLRIANINGEFVVSNTSRDGVFVIGADGRITPVRNNYTLRPGDQVLLGPTGPRLILRNGTVELLPPRSNPASNVDLLQHVDVQRSPANQVFSPQAIEQSNQYHDTHQVDVLLPGFQTAGKLYSVDSEGNFRDSFGNPTTPCRAIIVYDPPNDPILRDVFNEARSRFGHLTNNPQRLMQALTEYAHQLLETQRTGHDLNNWHGEFLQAHSGERILLGEMIRQGGGVCSEQSMLLCALAQSMGLSPTLVRGMGGRHAWVEMNINGRAYIYDPRNYHQANGRLVDPITRQLYSPGM